MRVDYNRCSSVKHRPEPHSYYSHERQAWLTYTENFSAPDGMAKEPARCWLQRRRHELAEAADNEYSDLYGVIVRCTWEDIDIGKYSLWSVYATWDDMSQVEDAFIDFAEEAVEQADKWLADKQAKFAPEVA